MVIGSSSRETIIKEKEEQNVVVPAPHPPINPPSSSIKTLDSDRQHQKASGSSSSSTLNQSCSAEMNRESRHVRVDSLPRGFPQDRLKDYFSGFGRVQKVLKMASNAEDVDKDAVIVSFMDVRSAQKACSSHSGEPKLDGHLLRIQFYEPNLSSKK